MTSMNPHILTSTSIIPPSNRIRGSFKSSLSHNWCQQQNFILSDLHKPNSRIHIESSFLFVRRWTNVDMPPLGPHVRKSVESRRIQINRVPLSIPYLHPVQLLQTVLLKIQFCLYYTTITQFSVYYSVPNSFTFCPFLHPVGKQFKLT